MQVWLGGRYFCTRHAALRRSQAGACGALSRNLTTHCSTRLFGWGTCCWPACRYLYPTAPLPQAAERLLAACAATQGCGRTAAAYYQQLLDSGAAVPASVHANGLLGLLDSIHGTDSTEAATAAAAAAVSLLEQRYTDLSTLHAGLLDAQVLGAAAHALQRQTSSRGSMTAYRAAAAVQASSVSSKEAAEQLYSSLEPPAQLAAWGLRLAAAVDRSSKDDATLQQVVGGVSSTMRHTGGQLLALLRLLPLWLPDFRPSSPDWGDALAAARRQLGSGSLRSEDARLVAQQVAAIGSELRQQAGDDWPTSLPTPALVRRGGIATAALL